jgi:hypothetical protein
MADKMLVRLKPYDPKRRHVMQSYTHAPSGLRFEAARGWYKVDASIAAYLKTVAQIENDPDSPLAFDVMTDDQALEVDEREEVQKQQKASAANPNELDQTPSDLTTADLHTTARRGVTEPQTRADAPTPGLRRDGAVQPGAPPHYAADDPRGYHKVVHKEELPDIQAAIPGPPPVVGAIAGGGRKASADDPHEPTPMSPPMMPGMGAPNPAVGFGNCPPPGYGDPESLEAHVAKTSKAMQEEAAAAEKAEKAGAQRQSEREAQQKQQQAQREREQAQKQQQSRSQHPPTPDEK